MSPSHAPKRSPYVQLTSHLARTTQLHLPLIPTPFECNMLQCHPPHSGRGQSSPDLTSPQGNSALLLRSLPLYSWPPFSTRQESMGAFPPHTSSTSPTSTVLFLVFSGGVWVPPPCNHNTTVISQGSQSGRSLPCVNRQSGCHLRGSFGPPSALSLFPYDNEPSGSRRTIIAAV